jgi:hypothetical protein
MALAHGYAFSAMLVVGLNNLSIDGTGYIF